MSTTSSSNFYESTPSFKGQFKTISQKEFGAVREDKFNVVRLKKIWRKKILAKIEELKDIRSSKGGASSVQFEYRPV